jgi:uncharacterized membrane protein
MELISRFWQEASGILLSNTPFMSWNLFLALIPLVMSFWIFQRPASSKFYWGTLTLLGLTLFPNIYRLIRKLIYFALSPAFSYVEGVILLTIVLILIEKYLLRRYLLAKTRSLSWWLGFFIFIAFLPNAPYVLTDIIHLYRNIRQDTSVWVLTLAIVPQYVIYMLIGFQSYVLSLMRMTEYLQKNQWGKYINIVEIFTHLLMAIGIYIGRFQRFNSWDILAQPDVLMEDMINNLIGKQPILVILVTTVILAVMYAVFKILTLGILKLYQDHQSVKKLLES